MRKNHVYLFILSLTYFFSCDRLDDHPSTFQERYTISIIGSLIALCGIFLYLIYYIRRNKLLEKRLEESESLIRKKEQTIQELSILKENLQRDICAYKYSQEQLVQELEMPTRLQILARTWQEHNPEWVYHLWNGEEMDELVKKHFPEYLAMYKGFSHNVQRWDTECFQPIDTLLENVRIGFGEEPPIHTQGKKEVFHEKIKQAYCAHYFFGSWDIDLSFY